MPRLQAIISRDEREILGQPQRKEHSGGNIADLSAMLGQAREAGVNPVVTKLRGQLSSHFCTQGFVGAQGSSAPGGEEGMGAREA